LDFCNATPIKQQKHIHISKYRSFLKISHEVGLPL